MPVTGKTRVYGIIGDPVEHSLSPVMQNAAFAAARLDCVYVPFHVSPSSLSSAIAGFRALGIAGFNVTVPHKVAVIPFLDEVSPEALQIGAVNTVNVENGRYVGYNTDGRGFLASVRSDLGFDPRGKKVVLAGAGGAARAAVHALCGAGARVVVVANRTVERAGEMVAAFGRLFPAVALESSPLTGDHFSTHLADADLVVNTTSAALAGDSVIVDVADLSASSVVYDMVYSETLLLRHARARGLRGAGGLGMLVGQGEAGFSIWTGRDPEPGVMAESLRAFSEG